MKTQRKLLTDEQKKKICKEHKICFNCPMLLSILDNKCCYDVVNRLEQEIKNYWDEEIDLGDSI